VSPKITLFGGYIPEPGILLHPFCRSIILSHDTKGRGDQSKVSDPPIISHRQAHQSKRILTEQEIQGERDDSSLDYTTGFTEKHEQDKKSSQNSEVNTTGKRIGS
jgi:hypothetical protein